MTYTEGYKTKSIFFGRQGGISTGIYNSLNCAFGSHDDPAHVRQNRAYVAAEIGVKPDNLVTLHQVHSSDVVTVNEPWQNEWPKADAMVTSQTDIALGILTADCAPVLFEDTRHGIIGAAHAGWRGAFSGILENTVAAMENLGAKRNYIYYMLGPCIYQKSYEVSHDFRQNFLNADQNWQQFFITSARADHYQFDLPGFVTARLDEAGIRNADDDRSDNSDTCPNETNFFSYRRATLRGEPDYGRQISVIVLKK